MTSNSRKAPLAKDDSCEEQLLYESAFPKIRSASQYFEDVPKQTKPNGPEKTPPVAPVLVTMRSSVESRTDSDGINRSRKLATKTTWRNLSVLYALCLVVLGAAYPLSEIISVKIQPFFYQSFYVFLYGTSLVYILFACVFSLNSGRRQLLHLKWWFRYHFIRLCSCGTSSKSNRNSAASNRTTFAEIIPNHQSAKVGSFYLRMGAVVFGIGSMLFSCLDFGQYFDMPQGDPCFQYLVLLAPVFRFVHTFMQLYFVFVNSTIRTEKWTTVTSFGLMHLIATNICTWLSVLIDETKHELDLSEFREGISFKFLDMNETFPILRSRTTNSSTRNYVDPSCRSRTSVGGILHQASPFLYPCIIECSLICATLVYAMWENVGKGIEENATLRIRTHDFASYKKKRQQYTVDCHGATRGLFFGLLLMLASIVSMVLYFVWIIREDYIRLAILQVNLMEIVLYSLMILAVAVAFIRMRKLKFDPDVGSSLSDILLYVSQTGVYVLPTFVLISGHHTVLQKQNLVDMLGLLSSFLKIIQSTFQTVFLMNGTRRRACSEKQIRHKPGREFVTFLLVCNFSLWALESMEAWRQQLYPQQIKFYGLWAWTLVTLISMPLTIFYRFHSSVCLSEIWKSSFKEEKPPISSVPLVTPQTSNRT